MYCIYISSHLSSTCHPFLLLGFILNYNYVSILFYRQYKMIILIVHQNNTVPQYPQILSVLKSPLHIPHYQSTDSFHFSIFLSADHNSKNFCIYTIP